MVDRIKSVRIEGFRCIQDLTVEPNGLQVLVGENGAGKSTIVEAFEILRRLPAPMPFIREFHAWHGDASDLIRRPNEPLRLTVTAQVDETLVRYLIELQGNADGGGYPFFAREAAWTQEPGRAETPLFDRAGSELRMLEPERGVLDKPRPLSPEESVLTALGISAPFFVYRLRTLLSDIEVMPSFGTRPAWAHSSDNGQSPQSWVAPMRTATQVEPVVRLQREARNLTSVFQQLLNGPKREQVIDDLRSGFGSEVQSLFTRSPAPGRLQLVVAFETRDVPVSQLSEGQLVFLALVALKHLQRSSSVLLIEEPELHLHPALVVRVGWLLEQMAATAPVFVTTHSDALLDSLSEPVESVRVVLLDLSKGTQLHKLSAERLAAWRVEFEGAGLGELRRENAMPSLMAEQ
jgi:predicted ATPase